MTVSQRVTLIDPDGAIEIRHVDNHLQAVLYRLGVERGRCVLRAAECDEDSVHEARIRLAPENAGESP